MALTFSRGQQQADMQGPLISTIVPGDATSGHGYNNGNIKIYSGSAPATADAAETGTILINWTTNATAFGACSAATPTVTTAGAVTNVSASATNTAGYGRLLANGDDGLTSTSERRIMFDVGAGSGSMSFNTLSITSGATASLTSLTITHG